jgi:FG-GAP-like repeat/Bacterial Ig-like domain (group 3)
MFPLRSLALSLSLACSAHALAQECNRLFEVPVTYRLGVNALRVVAADFDGDGRPDVAVAAAPSVQILLNRDGLLARGTPSTTPAPALNLFATQADGDGRTDLVSYGAAFIATHYSNGDGTFRTVTTALAGNPLLTVGAFADLNDDGRADLLAVAQGTGGRTLRVFAGAADGTFTALAETPLGTSATRLAAGDWTRDGKTDVVITSGAGTAALLHPGNGDGTFAASQAVLPESVIGAGPLASGDFDGDGAQDLVIAGESMSALFLSTRGAEPIASEVPVDSNFSVWAFDVDRDGRLDLVDDAAIVPGNGDGTFRRQVTNVWYLPVHGGSTGRDLTMADLDGDGAPDMIGAGGGTVRVRYSRGDLRFEGAQYFLMDTDRVVAADVNEDGRDDLVTFAFANMVFLSGPDGMPGEPKVMGNGDSGPGVTGDFNGDSHLDLGSAANWIAFGDGTGNFTPPRDLVDGESWGDVLDIVTADVNGDGSKDIVVGTTQDLRILVNDGTGRFTMTVRPGRLEDLAAGDFDRNGKSDLLGISDDELVLLADGGAAAVTLLEGVQPSPFGGGSGLEAVDVDGDGLLDAVALATSGTELLVLGGNGNGTFRAPRSVPVSGTGNFRDGFDWGAFTAADFTGDGRIDFLAAPFQREARLLAQQPDGSFVEVTRMAATRNFSITSGDFDGDGHPDLLGRDTTLVVIHRNRCREELRAIRPLVGITASSSRTSATVRASVPAAAAGFVEFYRRLKTANYWEVESIGTAAVADGVATLTAELPAGTHELYALYSGDGAYSLSYSRTIDVAVSGDTLPRRRSVRH